jgi:hypothetical protein
MPPKRLAASWIMPQLHRLSDYDYDYDNEGEGEDDRAGCSTYFAILAAPGR